MSIDIDPSLTVADILKPADQQDDFTKWMLTQCHGVYIGAKKLPDGTYSGVMKLAFTEAICLGVTHADAAQKRYCYEQLGDLLIAFYQLKSFNDEPTGWRSSRPKPTPRDCRPIETAPVDGSYIRAFHFDQFGGIQWCRTGAFQNGWTEVDSLRDGEPINPTHWLPYV